MTSQERFEAKYGKRKAGLSAQGLFWDLRLSTWQAAERDMLELAIAAAKNERLIDNTNEPTDLAYNTAISHVVYKLNELLNEPTR
jgi:hypothetical protein